MQGGCCCSPLLEALQRPEDATGEVRICWYEVLCKHLFWTWHFRCDVLVQILVKQPVQRVSS